MAKFKNLLTSIFPKSNSKLETDAAVIPQRSDNEDKNKSANSNNAQITMTTMSDEDITSGPSTSSTHLLVAADAPAAAEQLELTRPGAGQLTQNFVSNVQNNTLSAPHTSISNAAGVQVFQIKNAKNVHIGNSFTFNPANTGDDRTQSSNGNGQIKWANLKLSDTIKQMMDSDEELDTGMMDTMSRHLGYEWKSFARALEYSEGQIQAFECDHKTLSEQIYQFVLDWTRNDDNPTLGNMVKLLWENKHKETVYHLKLLWKKRRQNPVE